MKLKLLLAFFLMGFQLAFSQWTNLSTGINDNLTGGVFFQNNGMVSGAHGLYYTTNGGAGAASWTRFQITGNAADSAIYENTVFKHCYSNPNNSGSSGSVFACGKDQVTQKAVIMKVTLPALTYEILYVGTAGSSLNKIGFHYNNSYYYAVGDAGLIVRFSNFSSGATANTISADNLQSIDFTPSGNCSIGLPGKILRVSNMVNFTSTELLTPLATNTSICSDYNTTYVVGNNLAQFNNSGTVSRTEYNNYDYGPLNANAVWPANSDRFVGTDHGIFKGAGDGTVLCWQPTSMNYTINGFWSQSIATIYAFGNNGLLLKTTNGGGSIQPYAKINTVGACVNTSVPLTAKIGAATSYKWYVDGVQVSTAFNPGSHTFNTVGTHEIKLIVANGYALETTVIKNIEIVSLPEINKPVTISDNILCHSETIEIQVANSQPNVVYTLMKDSNTYGTSQPGNGGTITFTSSLLTESGNYYLQARNPVAPCVTNFSDQIVITVEQTKADFHADLINVLPNETVNLYSHSEEAQNFQWDFASAGPLMNSTLEHPTVSFPSAGPATINLDCWSNNGCHDEMEKPSFVYDQPVNPDQCWTMVNSAPDPDWNGFFYDGISKITPISDGFLTCGGFKDGVFDSKIGISYSLPGGSTYLEKHDKNGTLKWFVSMKHLPYFNDDRGQMFSVVEDQLGDIYICGSDAGTFIDNHGDEYNLAGISGTSETYYIIKLDSKGKFLWKLTGNSDGFSPRKLYIDRTNNLVVTGFLWTDYQTGHQMYFNNQPSFVINQEAITETGVGGNSVMLKISPSGSLIWNVAILLNHANPVGLEEVGFDDNNNIYLSGTYEHSVQFYSVGNATPQTLAGGSLDYRLFLAKYNSDGILQWKTRSTLVGSFFNDVKMKSMVTDNDGTCYITGRNLSNTTAANQVFDNADGSVIQNNVGQFFVLKVDSNGICQWIVGDKSAKYSDGCKIIKDGNRLHIVGEVSSSNSVTAPTIFAGTDLESYSLVMNHNDIFMVTYDLDGNLIRVITSGETLAENNAHSEITGFFKGDNNTFYLSRNFGEIANYSFFGDAIATNEVDGMITKFNAGCGLLKYQRQLSVNDYEELAGVTLFPNPTNGDFVIDLKENQSEVVVEIFDVLGKRISNQRLTNVKEINTSIHADKGLYFVKVSANNKMNCFKLVKN